jgi:hypothetical protein
MNSRDFLTNTNVGIVNSTLFDDIETTKVENYRRELKKYINRCITFEADNIKLDIYLEKKEEMLKEAKEKQALCEEKNEKLENRITELEELLEKKNTLIKKLRASK